jgi:hypothetical protein
MMRLSVAEFRHLVPKRKVKKKPVRVEDLIQQEIFEFFVNEMPHTKPFAIPNGEKRHISVAKRLKAVGVVSGVADLCVLFPQCFPVFFEVKAPKGSLRREQREFLKWLKDNDYRGRMVRSLGEVKDALIEWGLA